MEDVECIELPTPFGVGSVNCYLAEGDGLALIDPGPDSEECYETLRAGVADLGYSIADIDRILITHEHIDHFGIARRLKDQADAHVVAHRDAVDRVANPTRHLKLEQAFFDSFLVRMGLPEQTARVVKDLPDPYAEYRQPVAIDRILEDGDTVEFGEHRSLTVAHTPGHAPGAVCFLSADDGVAFTGDHVLKDITPNPLLTVTPGNPSKRTRSLPAYIQSLEKLLEMEVEEGFGGHRERIPDVQRRVRETISHHESRKDRIAALISDRGPSTACELMQELFPGLPTTETFAGMSEVIGHLDLLEDEGRLVRQEDDGKRLYDLR